LSARSLAVVGGGILGLATAVEAARRGMADRVVVLEKEQELARHQTGRNSCVIHSGVYYAPGSHKARLCVRGRALLLDFCDEEGVTYDLCGKLVVAVDALDEQRLAELERRARANGVEGLSRLGPAEFGEIEPHVRGLAALHVPSSGIVDFRLVASALAERLTSLGGEIRLGTRVTALDEGRRGVVVRTPEDDLLVDHVVACAGLQADRLIRSTSTSIDDATSIVPFRGSYYALRPSARHLCRALIYPVPDPEFPFLGVHLSRRPDGQVWAGPSAFVALAREGYGRGSVDVRDAFEVLTSRPLWRLGRRHWRVAVDELLRDLAPALYAREIARYVPAVGAADLERAPAGVRPQALRRDGTLVDDFLFVETGRIVHVKNAPSPAATAALAIAEEVASRLQALSAR
jgi:(S)-2-hydroxyglutarate dehydrogenase